MIRSGRIGCVMKKKSKYLAALVALATFILYLPALRNGIVYWDDYSYIIANPHIRSFDSAFFRWAFFDFYEANWYPLTWISHAVDYALWGLKPFGHHLTNNIIHAVNAGMVALLAIKILEVLKEKTMQNDQSPFLNERIVFMTGGATGLLFGIHPIHVESVAWIAERKDLLCALFFLLSIMAYVKYACEINDKKNNVNVASRLLNRQYLLALGFFVLALLSKPMAVTLPAVLLILDWYPLLRINSSKALSAVLIEKLPFIAMSLASSILTILAQRSAGAIQSTVFASFPTRVFVATQSLVVYLWKMVWPLNLVPYYPYPENAQLLSVDYLGAFVLAIGITTCCLIIIKKQKLWMSVWSYYVVVLLPVLGIVQVGGQSMADRYTYLPSLGPMLVTGMAVAWIADYSMKLSPLRAATKFIISTMVIGAFALLSYLTFNQIGIWNNGIILWNYVIEREPEAIRAYYNRGLTFGIANRPDRAIKDFDKAISMDPYFTDAYMDRGATYAVTGRYDKAIEDYNKVIALNPSNYEAYCSRGVAFEQIGQIERAIKDYDQAIVLNPAYHETYIKRGILRGKIGLLGLAIDDFNHAIDIKPADAEAFVSRGTAFALMDQNDRAMEDFNKAIELDHSISVAYLNRGRLYLKKGNKEHARSDFQKACELGNSEGCKALL